MRPAENNSSPETLQDRLPGRQPREGAAASGKRREAPCTAWQGTGRRGRAGPPGLGHRGGAESWGGWRPGCQPRAQAGGHVLPPVPTGWQQPPAAPAGHPPYTPPHRARRGAQLCPGLQPSSTAGAPGRTPPPQLTGTVFQPEGWKKRKLSTLLLPWALAAVGSPMDPFASSGVTQGPPSPALLPGCADAAGIPHAGQIGMVRLPFPPVGLSPLATTGRGEEAPRKQSPASTSATERGDTPVAACGSPLLQEFAWFQHHPRAASHPRPTPGLPASATSAGGAESWPVWLD